MAKNISAIHHYHKRKRVHKKLEKYPHPDKFKRIIDKIIYIAAFAGPIMTIPQVIGIWVGKNSSGVSVISWISYAILSSIWLIYGIVHKEKPIIISSIIWIILDIFIVVGVILY